MVTTQLNIKNRTYYFYNDLIEYFHPKLLKLDKKPSVGVDIDYIGWLNHKKA